ncbi:MAG TPA: GTP-binding protein, partial [Kofleriaceae bacterium]|nr:GTP-binding protein [Kofleriaceae bacterium]
LLAAAKGRRIAVLVNELGRVAIDTRRIVARGGDVLELAGGCVCCKIDVKNDLWDGIADVIRRSRPEHVVLETTGIAEPGAIWAGLSEREATGEVCVAPAGVVCVVDAEAGVLQLARHEEAREQIRCADRVLLSKLDLATADATLAIHDRVREINPDAERASFPDSRAGNAGLVSWLLARAPAAPGAGPRAHVHRQGQLAAAVVVVADEPLVAAPLLALLGGLGDRLVRAKGEVWMAGEDRRGILDRAGLRLTLSPGAPWGKKPPRTELVLIGDDLDEAALARRIWGCRAGGG